MKRCVSASILVAILVVGVARASAATPAVVIDNRAPALAAGDDGAFTAALGFTNLTSRKVTLSAKPAQSDTGCDLALDPASLPRAAHTDVTVTIPAACSVSDDDGIDFKIAATAGSTPLIAFNVSAAPEPADQPDWDNLWAFVIAFGVLTLGAVVYFVVARPQLAEPLKYLDATWSFQDSWVSNVTVLAGILTGVFGSSDVVKAFLGTDAETSIALATVGAAIAAAFIAAGPIVLFATKKRADDAFTLGGLVAASVVTLTGAFGELWVVYATGHKLDLGGWEDRIWIVLVLAAGLLALYAIRTLIDTVVRGTTEPAEAEPSDTIRAAEMIVAALKAKQDISADQVSGEIESLPAVAPRPRRLSALL